MHLCDLLAMAGLWPLWLRSRRMAVLVALMVLPLTVQGAWHNWHGSGTTPLRIVTAVMPLLAIPLADAFAHFRRSRWFLVTFAALAAVSVANGVSFNTHFERARPVLVGPTVSGWLSRLAFPTLDTPDWMSNPLVIFWSVITVLLLLSPVIRARPNPRGRWSWTSVTATVLVGLAAGGSAIGAWTGAPFRTRFLFDYGDARASALRFHLAHRDGSLWSAQRGHATVEEIFPNPAGLDVTVTNDSPVALVQDEVVVTVGASGPDGAPGWGTFAVDFGEGARSGSLTLVGTATASHAYAKPGEYQVSVLATMPGAGEMRRNNRVKVIPPNLIGPYGLERIPGLPREFIDFPVTISIDRITISESGLELDCSMASRQVPSAADYWVWLIGYEQQNLRARLHAARRVTTGDDPRRFVLAIAPGSNPDPGRPATVLVSVSPKQESSATFRSPALFFPWPAPELTTGAPIVVTAAESR